MTSYTRRAIIGAAAGFGLSVVGLGSLLATVLGCQRRLGLHPAAGSQVPTHILVKSHR